MNDFFPVMYVNISDIIFAAFSDQKLYPYRLEGDCENFICTGKPEVRVFGHYDGLPDLPFKKENRVFSSSTFWHVHILNGKTLFLFRSPFGRKEPYCLAVFSPDYKMGDVYYQVVLDVSRSPVILPHPLAFPLFHLLMISILAKGYGVLIHACGIDDRGDGLLFAGSSTHGKTTIARLWQNKATVLNDERVVLRQNNGRFWIYGTPWHGEYNEVSCHGVPLKKIFFLKKAETNSTIQLGGVIAASKLLTHCFMPYWEKAGMNFIIEFCAAVTAGIPSYELSFTPDEGIIDFVRCAK